MTTAGGLASILLLIVIPLAALILFISAIVSIAKHPTASGTEKVLWLIVALVFPFVGSILWFAIGKNSATGATRG